MSSKKFIVLCHVLITYGFHVGVWYDDRLYHMFGEIQFRFASSIHTDVFWVGEAELVCSGHMSCNEILRKTKNLTVKSAYPSCLSSQNDLTTMKQCSQLFPFKYMMVIMKASGLGWFHCKNQLQRS